MKWSGPCQNLFSCIIKAVSHIRINNVFSLLRKEDIDLTKYPKVLGTYPIGYQNEM